MSIQIKRATGIYGSFLKFNVLVNGEKVKTIEKEDKINLEIPNDTSTIQLSQGGLKTNQMEVTNGDKIEVTATFWRTYGFFIVMILFFLTNPFIHNIIRYGLLITYLLCAILIDGMMFRINRKSNSESIPSNS